MPWIDVIWIDGPDGNAEHIAEHGIDREEVEHVLRHPIDSDVSRTTGRPIAFGRTAAGRGIAVVYEWIDAVSVYPITAYDLED